MRPFVIFLSSGRSMAELSPLHPSCTLQSFRDPSFKFGRTPSPPFPQLRFPFFLRAGQLPASRQVRSLSLTLFPWTGAEPGETLLLSLPMRLPLLGFPSHLCPSSPPFPFKGLHLSSPQNPMKGCGFSNRIFLHHPTPHFLVAPR